MLVRIFLNLFYNSKLVIFLIFIWLNPLNLYNIHQFADFFTMIYRFAIRNI